MNRGETLTAEAWTFGIPCPVLEYEWKRGNHTVSIEKSYTIPNTPSDAEVQYSCTITPNCCLRNWRSREVRFTCPPNGKYIILTIGLGLVATLRLVHGAIS